MASTWHQRFAIVDQLLLKILNPVQTAPELAWAWAQMVGLGGCMPVHQLAVDVGWSWQHFGKRFFHEFGVSPKAAGRIFRFENAVRLFKSGCTELSRVAAECGFYDQAHLTLEWKTLTGRTPKAWIEAELPFFQYTVHSSGEDRL